MELRAKVIITMIANVPITMLILILLMGLCLINDIIVVLIALIVKLTLLSIETVHLIFLYHIWILGLSVKSIGGLIRGKRALLRREIHG